MPLAFGLLAPAAFALGDSLDFEAGVYQVGQGVAGVDNWVLYPNGMQLGINTPFIIQSDTGNKYLSCHPDLLQSYGVSRPFLPTGGVDYVDVQWKWRAESDTASLCAGIASQPNSGTATPKATVCLEPHGSVTAARGTGSALDSATKKWVHGIWYYTKIRLDISKGIYSVYSGSNPQTLADSANLLFASEPMQGAAGQQVQNFFLSAARGANTDGNVDIDDIVWIGVRDNIWVGTGTGTNLYSWYNSGNWSLGTVPDSNDIAVFGSAASPFPSPNSNRKCNLNYPGGTTPRARVFGLLVATSYTDTINLESDTLTVLLAAGINGGHFQANGGFLRFAYPSLLQVFADSTAVLAPPVLQEGPGLLTLAGSGSPIDFMGYRQTGGGLNFNGTNMTVMQGNLVVSGGANPDNPGVSGWFGLDNRTVAIPEGTLQFLGADTNDRLSLTAAHTWNLQAGGSVYARNVVLRNSHVQSTTTTAIEGNAVASVDSGGNQGWIFWTPPTIVKQPQPESLLVGAQAQFTLTVTQPDSVQYQWQRDSGSKYVELAGANAATLQIAKVAFKDDTLYRCRVSNLADTVFSKPARLAVRFPAPTANPPAGKFQDSLAVTLQDSAVAAAFYYSLNQGALQLLPAGDSVRIKDTATLSAFAVTGNDTSARASFIYTKVASGGNAAVPVAVPTSGTFPDTFSVSLNSATSGASIRYTTDGSAVTPSSPLYQNPIPIRSNITLRAVAYDPPNLNPSDTLTQSYVLAATSDSLIPPQMSAAPGFVFSDSVTVTLSALEPSSTIYYRVAGGPLVKYQSALVFKANTTVTAAVVSGGKSSRDTAWTFTRVGLASPLFTPLGRAFSDSMQVTLSLASGMTGTIHYTLTGQDPDSASPLYKNPLVFDTSTEIRAIAVQGSLTSAVHAETYTLAPDTPQVSPPAGSYPDSVTVSLISIPQAHVYYTTDSSSPNPGTNGILYTKPITLRSNTVIEAVAVAGQGVFQQKSGVRVAAYVIASSDTVVVAAKDTVPLPGGFQLRNLGSAADTVLFLSSDSLPAGFADLRFLVRVIGSGGTPAVQFLDAAKDSLGLYSARGDTVLYLGKAAGATVTAAGEYFAGIDTLPPEITLLQETILANDSTQVQLSIKDNVANLVLTVTRSDRSTTSVDSVLAPLEYSTVLKNPAGSFQPLTLRIQVGDGRNVSAFPAPPAKSYALSQALSGGAGPKVWSVGQSTSRPWDFVGLPFAPASPLTLQSLRDLNDLPHLSAMVYDTGANSGYRALAAGEAWPAGQALWLANDKPVPALTLPALKTSALGLQSMSVDLKPGWNPICSQRFDTLFWPVKRGANYTLSSVKGLWSYFNATDSDGYQAADTLLPWRGYWVYNAGDHDTTVSLSAAALSKTAVVSDPLEVALLPSRGIPLYLGADAAFTDGVGREDEPMPPQPFGQSWAALLRNGIPLMTDQVHYQPGSPLQWKLVSSGGGANGGGTQWRLDSTQWILPDGYEVWAVSQRRGLRFRMQPGTADAWAGPSGFTDTLALYAAPETWIAANLGQIPTQVGALQHRLRAIGQGVELDLVWPGDGPLRTEVFDTRGRKLAATAQTLPAGYYHLFLALPRVSGLLLLRFTGENGGRPVGWTDRLLP